MLFLDKKQVKALIDIMKEQPTRPALQQLWFEDVEKDGDIHRQAEFNTTYLCATNSYTAALIKVEMPTPAKDRVIPMDALVRFYKLWERKTVLNELELDNMLEPVENTPPQLIKHLRETYKKAEPVSHVSIDPDYAKHLEQLAGELLQYETHGLMGPYKAVTSAGNEYYLMPRKV